MTDAAAASMTSEQRLLKRVGTFWISLAPGGEDVEIWETRPDRIDFGDGWITYSGILAIGGSSLIAKWPIARCLAEFRTKPDTDRELIVVGS